MESQSRVLQLETGERLVVRSSHGDSLGSVPGMEVYVEKSEDDTRLPTKQEIEKHRTWISETLAELAS